jgi:nucleoside phosphorylase
MALIEREVGVAIAATAATLSPRVRRVARQGAVYGLAGALKVGDVAAATARGIAQGAQEVGSAKEPQPAAAPSRASARKSSARTRQAAARSKTAPTKRA